MSYSTGLQSITGSVNAVISTISNIPLPNSDQTLIRRTSSISAETITLFYTVPANKVFYLFGASLFKTAANYAYVYDGTGSTADGTEAVILGFNQDAGYGTDRVSSTVPIEKYTAGQLVRVWAKLAGQMIIWGVLVDA